MKVKPESFWRWLASEPITGASLYSWRSHPAYYRVLRTFLRKTGEQVSAVICPRCNLPHRIAPGGRGGTIAVSTDGGCEDFQVDSPELFIHAVNYDALLHEAARCLPIQTRAEQIGNSAAWLLGIGVRRNDRAETQLVACLSTKQTIVQHAIRSVHRLMLKGCILATASGSLSEIEDQLGTGARACSIDGLVGLGKAGFIPGPLARQLLAGWPNETANASAAPKRERAFERFGFRASKIGNKPFQLPLWRCHFEGRSFDLPAILGSDLLVKVIAADGEPVHADSLLRSAESSVVGLSASVERSEVEAADAIELGGSVRRQIDSREQILDATAIKRLQEALRKKRAEIGECGDDPNLAGEKERLQADLDEGTKYLLKSTRPGPRGTRLPKSFDDSLSKAGNLVGKHFRKAVLQLKAIDRPFWEHLTGGGVLKFGIVCRYDRQGGEGWHITGSGG